MIIRPIASTEYPQCEAILRTLPQWFGIESAIQDYAKAIETMPTWVVEKDTKLLGFAAINSHFACSAEIHVMGILPNHHRQGLGRFLLAGLEKELRAEHCLFLQVKTLSSRHSDSHYALTRSFYQSMGFVPLQEFPELWGPDNPCLQMIKKL
jgi:GNAT superfamily N-acetyltransferase